MDQFYYRLVKRGDAHIPERCSMREAFSPDVMKVLQRTNLYKVWVSTVFLAIDHSWGDSDPLLFETMVFPNDSMLDKDMARCSTYEQAVTQHNEMVTKWEQQEHLN